MTLKWIRTVLRRSLGNLNVVAVRYLANLGKRSSGQGSAPVAGVGDVPGQFAAAVRRALVDPRKRDEEDLPMQHDARNPPQSAKAPGNPETASPMTPAQPAWDAPGIPTWLSDALAQLEDETAQQTAAIEETQARASAEAPSDRVSTPGNAEDAVPHFTGLSDYLRRTESNPSEAKTMQQPMDMNAETRESQQMEPRAEAAKSMSGGNLAEKRASRLSGLRGMVTAADLRLLSEPKRAEMMQRSEAPRGVPASLIEALTEAPGRLAGLKGLVAPADLKELNQARPDSPQSNESGNDSSGPALDAMAQEPRIVEVTQTQEPEAEPQAAEERAIARGNSFAANAKAHTDAIALKASESERPERNTKNDEVQILPAKRGQYGRRS
jgi:hypothetical protein